MSFTLCFTEDFFTGTESLEDIEPSKNPTNILQGIVSWYLYDPHTFKEMVQEVLGTEMPDYLPETLPFDLLDKVREVNTCTDLSSPVSVWIDTEGYHTIEVYDSKENG